MKSFISDYFDFEECLTHTLKLVKYFSAALTVRRGGTYGGCYVPRLILFFVKGKKISIVVKNTKQIAIVFVFHKYLFRFLSTRKVDN